MGEKREVGGRKERGKGRIKREVRGREERGEGEAVREVGGRSGGGKNQDFHIWCIGVGSNDILGGGLT